MQQAATQLLLEPSDGGGEGRLGYVRVARGRRECPVLHDQEEVSEIVEHAHTIRGSYGDH